MTIYEDAAPSREVMQRGTDITFTENPDSLTWHQAQEVEFKVFSESGYVKSQEELAKDYEVYDPYTGFALTRLAGEPAGAVRMIFHNPETGFKTTNDAQTGELTIDDEGWEFIAKLDPDTIMEIGTISIPEELRGELENGLRLNSDLYGAIYAISKARSIDWLIASFDHEYLERFGKIFGASITRLGPAKDYMGSPTVPVIINVEDAIQSVADVGLQDTFDSIHAVAAELKHEHRPAGPSSQ